MDQFFKEIEDYCEAYFTVADYFLTVGFTDQVIKDHLECGEELIPSVLSQFPPSTRGSLNLPTTLPMFCFPWGASISQSKAKLATNLFNLILQDDLGTPLYCTCLHVLEERGEEMKQDRNAINLLPSTSTGSDSTFETASERSEYFSPENIRVTISECPNYEQSSTDRDRSVSEFYTTSLPSSPTFKYKPVFLENQNSKIVPKAIVIVSRSPYLEIFKRILLNIYKMSTDGIKIPMECVISHLMLTIPHPPKGEVELMYLLNTHYFKFSMPPKNQLPLLDVNLGVLFHRLDLDKVMCIFQHLSLERSIVFLSTNEDLLTSCSYCLLSLLYPLQWTLLYIPVLPEKMIDFLYSPIKYVFGVHSKYKEAVYARCMSSACIVDLDENSIETTAQAVKISQTARYGQSTLPNLPEHYGKKLHKELSQSLLKAGGVKANSISLSTPKLDEFTIKSIRQSFFKYYVSIFLNYGKYVNMEWTEYGGSKFFSHHEFLETHPDNSRSYMKEMINSQMFSSFLEKKLRPKNNDDYFEVLYFDESIVAKMNRSKLKYTKASTPFIEDKSVGFKDVAQVPSLYSVYPAVGWFQYKNFPDFDLQLLSAYGLPKNRLPKCRDYPDTPSYTNIYIPHTHWPTNQHCVIACWIEVWAASLWHQDLADHSDMLNKAIFVLGKYHKFPTPSLLSAMLESCCEFNASLGISLFSFLSSSKFLIDMVCIKILRKTVSKLLKGNQNMEDIDCDRSLMITNAIINSDDLAENSRKRIFTGEGEINIFVRGFCKVCGRKIPNTEIAEQHADNPYSLACRCKCGELYQPQLKVRNCLDDAIIVETIFMSPKSLRQSFVELIKDKDLPLKLDFDILRLELPMIFWNLIWQFNLSSLPFEFLFPYESQTTSFLTNSIRKEMSTQTESYPNLAEVLAIYEELVSQ
ncbi:unnamed protein product [Blepharisma stoltei]|uniref:UDENN domain-containing protein n=1 Tax=Blepharisma stoltei TaxID=1481888 RepID=A0AAU9K875_9CILI|nr:unnamed protein product [Blepharisma stoltei]